MTGLIITALLFALVLFLGGPVLAIIALSRANTLGHRLRDLDYRLQSLEAARRRDRAETVDHPPSTAPAAPEAKAEEPPDEDRSAAPPVSVTQPLAGMAPRRTPPPVTIDAERVEQTLTSKWMVWVGGVALALGGAFLVKFTIDEGLLGPGMRILLGLLAAAAMMVTGEWLRRRGRLGRFFEDAPDYVPAALTAAGVFTAFATLYAAYALYDMLGPLPTFALLAGVAVLGLLMSLMHGPFLALLGLAGAFVIPMLVSTDSPNAWTLFGYLLAVGIGGLGVIRHRDWWRTSWAIVVGAAGWPVLWAVTQWHQGDALPVGLYALAMSGAFLLWLHPALVSRGDTALPPWPTLEGLPPNVQMVFTVVATMGVVLFLGMRIDHYSVVSLVLMGLFVVLVGAVARRRPEIDILVPGAIVLVILALALWHMPDLIAGYPPGTGVPSRLAYEPIVPPQLEPFVTTTVLSVVLLGGGAFAALWGAARPAYWAAISTTAPLVLTAVAYWRVQGFAPNLFWGLAGLALAGPFLLAAERVARYRADPAMKAALGAYAVGVVAAVALAFAMVLEEAWLTVALAAQLPAIAWVYRRLELPALRVTALVVAGVALVRLVANPYVLDYAIGAPLPGINWLLYGYGLPAVAFYLARRLFIASADDRLVQVLEAGVVAFTVLFVSLQIRALTSQDGTLTGDYGFLEQGLQTIAWITTSYVLLVLEGRQRRPVFRYARHGLTGLAVANLMLFAGLVHNPLFNAATRVGDWPLLNLLAVGLAIPAGLCLATHRRARAIGADRTAAIYGIAGFVLAFVWLTLEVRHGFHGSVMALGGGRDVSERESYAYSIAWLAYAGVLVGLGLWRAVAALRYASLVVLVLAVFKVFVIDMSTLDGLWRALSFLGLGSVLVAIGFFYQRIMFATEPSAKPPAQTGP